MTDRLRHLSRRLVNAFLAGAAAWPYNRAATQLTLNETDQVSLQHKLIDLFENPRSACAIGMACLKSLPLAQESSQQLASAILAAAECDVKTTQSKHTIKDRIANRVRQDFAEQVVVKVEGWLLSQTEARLYALVALTLRSDNLDRSVTTRSP